MKGAEAIKVKPGLFAVRLVPTWIERLLGRKPRWEYYRRLEGYQYTNAPGIDAYIDTRGSIICFHSSIMKAIINEEIASSILDYYDESGVTNKKLGKQYSAQYWVDNYSQWDDHILGI